MTRNEHFETAEDWAAATRLVGFEPRYPVYTAGFELVSLEVHVMDHRKRRLAVGDRSLEAHYGAFVTDQKRAASEAEARRLALSESYGSSAKTVRVSGHEGRSYPLGPAVPPDDVDGRAPAVVVWSDGPMFYLVASGELDEPSLLRIAESMY